MKDYDIIDEKTIRIVMDYLAILEDSLKLYMSANNKVSIYLGANEFFSHSRLYSGVPITGHLLREALKITEIAVEYLRKNSMSSPPIPDELEKLSYQFNIIDIDEVVENFFEARDKIFSLLYKVDEKNIIDQIDEIAKSDDYDKKLKLATFLRAICIGSLRRSKLLDFRLGKDVIEKLKLGIKGGGLASYIMPPMDDNEVMVRQMLDPRK